MESGAWRRAAHGGRCGDDLDARSAACYAAYLGGLVMTEAGTALHHKIRYVLGGRYNLPHAMLHAIVLPQAVA